MVNLQSRNISGKGTLRLDKTSQDYKSAKIITLYADVIRRPVNEYLNFNYNPPESRYATLIFFKDEYVVRVEPLRYLRQQFTFAPELNYQTIYAVQCAYAGLLQTFFNLGNALALPSISVTDHIKDWRHVDLWWDTVKVVCYADTAVKLVAESSAYDLCEEQENPTPTPPPPPQPPPPEITPGEPLGGDNPTISEPYPGDVESGDFDPYPGDYTPPDPEPEGTPLWTVTTTERVLTIISPDEPVVFSNFRCTTERGLQAVGHAGDNQLTQYCGEFSNYCLNEGESVVSVVFSGDYCEETYP